MKKHVIVTGGSRGLGLQIVGHLLANKYSVSVLSRNLSYELEQLILNYPKYLDHYQVDFRQESSYFTLFDKVKNTHKIIYGLVNNAAIAYDNLLLTQSSDQISDMIKVNVEAVIFLTQQIAKNMILNRKGRIVFISSIASQKSFPGLASYSACKGAIDSFSRVLARELGYRNITVNTVASGFLLTDMSSRLSEAQKEKIKKRTSLKRFVTLEEVSSAVNFLLSEGASGITGTSLVVDGGNLN